MKRKHTDLKPHKCITAQLIRDLRSLDYRTFRKKYGFTKIEYRNKVMSKSYSLVAQSHNAGINQEYRFM